MGGEKDSLSGRQGERPRPAADSAQSAAASLIWEMLPGLRRPRGGLQCHFELTNGRLDYSRWELQIKLSVLQHAGLEPKLSPTAHKFRLILHGIDIFHTHQFWDANTEGYHIN